MPEPDQIAQDESAIPEQILAEVWIYVAGDLIQKYAIEHGEYIIGRDPSCPIVVDADEVSRHHARLTFNAFELVIEDLGSSNGVFIDGQQVQLPTRVRLDQEVQIGAARLFIRLKESAAKQLAAALWDKDLGLGPVREQLEGKHYKVITTVNRGGMGVILQARDLRIRRTVAMKVMKTSSQFSRENVLRFIDEAQLTGQLEHPNIVPVYELGIDEQGETFYTMKFVKGITLDDVLRGIRHGTERIVERYPLGTLLTIFQKVCDGVAFAHSKGVVHRDLKPENIMIGSFGEVLVMDWGLAKNITAGRRDTAGEATAHALATASKFVDLRGFETLNGLIVGTPPYISPEQARGELDNIDPRTDLYVLGAILYTILTLRPPVEGDSVHEVVEKILGSQIAAPSTFNATPKADRSSGVSAPPVDQIVFHHCPGKRIPDGLSAVAMKALELDPTLRYQTVEDLQADITAFQGGFAPKAERASVLKHGLLFAGRHKREMVLFSIFAVLLLCTGVWFLLEVTREKNRAVKSAQVAEDKTQQLEVAMSELRGTAPTFFDDARMLATAGRFEDALEKVDYAIRQIPNVADYHVLRGNILLAMWRWNDAGEAFEDALARNPKHVVAQESLALTKRIIASLDDDGEPDKKLLGELRNRYGKQGWKPPGDGPGNRPRPMGMRGKDFPGFDPANRKPGIGNRYANRANQLPDGTWSLDLSKLPPADVMRILQARSDVSVSSLNLSGTGISDLSPLTSLPIKYLYLAGNPGIVNITPLAGMPLERLDLTGTKVNDLSPLGGSPLRELVLEACRNVSDLTALAQCEKLESLIVPSQVSDLEFLRGKPGLTTLGTSRPGRPAETFWKEFDARKQTK
jgi:serine/threonine protein kinase